MKIEVTNSGKKKNQHVPSGISIKNLLEKLKINPETVLITVNNEITLESEKLQNNDKVEIIRVASHG